MLFNRNKIPIKEIILVGFLPSVLKNVIYKIGKNASFGMGSANIGISLI